MPERTRSRSVGAIKILADPGDMGERGAVCVSCASSGPIPDNVATRDTTTAVEACDARAMDAHFSLLRADDGLGDALFGDSARGAGDVGLGPGPALPFVSRALGFSAPFSPRPRM